MKKITLIDLERCFSLLKRANNASSAFVSELAKEYGVKKTELMGFIEDNERCFVLSNKEKGLCVLRIYQAVEDNPNNKEWLELQKKKWSKTLYVSQWNCYGSLEDYYLPPDYATMSDSNDYSKRYNLWRNTKEKIDEVVRLGCCREGVGSIDMWSGTKIDHVLNVNDMRTLIENGWHLTGALPESIK